MRIRRPVPRGFAVLAPGRRRLLPILAVLALCAAGCGAHGRHGASRRAHTASGASRHRSAVAGARVTSPALAFTPSPIATSLSAKLSLQRQVGQLFLVGLNGSDVPAVSAMGPIDWGGVVFDSSNFSTDGQVAALAADIAAAARSMSHLPPLLAATQEGGPDTAFRDLPPESEPVIGATSQSQVAGSQALAAGKALRALGFNMTLAPLADVDIPGGALSGRLFSTDPGLVARLSAAAVDAYIAAGVICAVGHFPGSGAASADPDQMTATVGGSLAQLRARDQVPFAAVAGAAPVIVMSNASYAAFDGVTPASLLPQAVELLRSGYRFQGVVMSDDLDATLQATGSGPGQAAVQALDAGDDLLYITGPPSEQEAAYKAVLRAARTSSSVRALVHEALLRVLTLKARYGLLH